MSSNWSALHAQLVRSVNRHSAMIHFVAIFPPDNPTRTFRDPAHLFGWLQARDVDAGAKNTVLAHLLRSANGKNKISGLATELLLLALWPGLCLIRHRLRPLCRSFTLDADLVGGLCTCILAARPERITRVAATLLRNLERDLRRDYIRNNQTMQSAVDLDAVGHRLAQCEADRPEAILSAAQATLGEDGVLLAAVHIAGFNQKEAAKQLGISHEAARKRCQRALSCLLQKNDV